MPLLRLSVLIDCILSYRRRWAQRLNKSTVQGVPGAECAMHHCFVEIGLDASERTGTYRLDMIAILRISTGAKYMQLLEEQPTPKSNTSIQTDRVPQELDVGAYEGCPKSFRPHT